MVHGKRCSSVCRSPPSQASSSLQQSPKAIMLVLVLATPERNLLKFFRSGLGYFPPNRNLLDLALNAVSAFPAVANFAIFIFWLLATIRVFHLFRVRNFFGIYVLFSRFPVQFHTPFCHSVCLVFRCRWLRIF